jgi:hypothetical protein
MHCKMPLKYFAETEQMRITPVGFLGVGAPAPGERLEVDGNIRVMGNVTAAGDIQLMSADCAEDFDVCTTDDTEPGTVMVLAADGILHQNCNPYDRRVAGVVSGAGDYKPGIVLDKRASGDARKPVALPCDLCRGRGLIPVLVTLQ